MLTDASKKYDKNVKNNGAVKSDGSFVENMIGEAKQKNNKKLQHLLNK